jgi:hypothetical protein
MLLATTCGNGVTSGRLPETLQDRESPRPDCHACRNEPCSCGAERTRTADFLLAKQVLYQLSYRPIETSV